MSTYNGWSNYETWRVNLEMLDGLSIEDFGFTAHDPEEITEQDVADEVREMQQLADALEAYCNDVVEQDAKGFALDLAQSFLARVDWDELAEHMMDDAIAELA